VKLLALSTSTEAFSAAVLYGDAVVSHFEVAPNQHARRALPVIQNLLREADLTLSECDALALDIGPGSFTGVRIGASIIQGLALAHDLPVIPVLSLQALAQNAGDQLDEPRILAAIDAHVQAIYYAAFERDSSDLFQCIGNEVIIPPVEWKMPEDNKTWCCAGTGWHYFPNLSQNKRVTQTALTQYPDAGSMLKLAKRAFKEGRIFPAEQIAPVYLS